MPQLYSSDPEDSDVFNHISRLDAERDASFDDQYTGPTYREYDD